MAATLKEFSSLADSGTDGSASGSFNSTNVGAGSAVQLNLFGISSFAIPPVLCQKSLVLHFFDL